MGVEGWGMVRRQREKREKQCQQRGNYERKRLLTVKRKNYN